MWILQMEKAVDWIVEDISAHSAAASIVNCL